MCCDPLTLSGQLLHVCERNAAGVSSVRILVCFLSLNPRFLSHPLPVQIFLTYAVVYAGIVLYGVRRIAVSEAEKLTPNEAQSEFFYAFIVPNYKEEEQVRSPPRVQAYVLACGAVLWPGSGTGSDPRSPGSPPLRFSPVLGGSGHGDPRGGR